MPVFAALRHRRALRDQEDGRRVLREMRDGEHHFGYPLHRAAGIRPARMYRALTRLEQDGMVHTGWDDTPTGPRRWYQLTDKATVLWG